MVYVQKSLEVPITKTQLIRTEVETKDSITELQRDSDKVRSFTHQYKSDKIKQTMLSNNKLFRKYNNTKEILRKLTP